MEPDWSLLDLDARAIDRPAAARRRTAPAVAAPRPSVTQQDGATALTLGHALPFAQTRVGVDMTLTRLSDDAALVPLPEKLASEACQSHSAGSAWATSTVSGVGGLWDTTALETRLDPGAAQGSLAALATRSMVIGDTPSRLTLQSSVRLSTALDSGERLATLDQNARLSLVRGTSLILGHTRTTGAEPWQARLAAEQAIPGGLTLTGTLRGAGDGALAAAVSAGLHTTW